MSSKDDVITFSSYQEVQDLESAMMTSAVMSSQSADEESSAGALSVDDISSDITISSCEEKRKSWISVDEVNSDVSNQQVANVQPADAFCLRAKDSANGLCDDGIISRSVVEIEKKSVDGISHMLKRNQQVHSFKCVSVAVLQTTKEELVTRKDFRISAVASIQRTRWKESMAEIESCNCLKSRRQDLYYSGSLLAIFPWVVLSTRFLFEAFGQCTSSHLGTEPACTSADTKCENL
ncbi:hypothetical protein F511_39736 [Dorcoceras hygrometricum]|uniref:Uncharacterized protein n=1 Tax=Dorcoceras hygrometricum TaxID=472368 RepID=A0A2Z7BCB4_9LAMI|nr:hypothetical protein F511_39736 [Dorcoceras hygrometricum]